MNIGTLKKFPTRQRRSHARKDGQGARPFVAKVVRAFTEALHFIKTNKEETKH